jgi:hypothetical protein
MFRCKTNITINVTESKFCNQNKMNTIGSILERKVILYFISTALSVFINKEAIVIGPTPPGTGVM